MKDYLIEFTVLFSVVIIYYLQLANGKQDNTLGSMVYIPLIILSVKYPMIAFIGLVCIVLYNQQIIEGFNGSRLPIKSTSGNTTTPTSDTSNPTTSTTPTTSTIDPNTVTTTTNTPRTITTTNSVNPITSMRQQQQQDREKQLVKNVVSKIRRLRAQNRIAEVKDIIKDCSTNYGNSGFNEALQKCGIIDSSGNLLPPFGERTATINTENYSVSSSMLPITGNNSTNITQSGNIDRVSIQEDLQTGMSDRAANPIQRTSTNEVNGTSTSTEGYTNLY
jgi:hypothetical protein